VRDSAITLAHGSGGKAMRNLIEEICLGNFDNPLLAPLEDQARVDLSAAGQNHRAGAGDPGQVAAVASALVKPLWACT
jgi:hydrogenase maturation factor